VRLMQIQLCVIYVYTGMEKLKGHPWWKGSAVWGVLGNHQMMLFDLSFLQQWPLIIAAMTHLTLIFEIYFAVLVWIRPLRNYVLLFGLAFHAMIGFSMGLFFFSAGMMSAYVLFADPNWLRQRLPRFISLHI
jgi:hypothetical protein